MPEQRLLKSRRLARVLVEGRKEGVVKERCAEALDAVRRAAHGTAARVLGPAEAPIARIKDRARWHGLVKAPDAKTLHRVLAPLDRAKVKGATLIVDVDPVSLL